MSPKLGLFLVTVVGVVGYAIYDYTTIEKKAEEKKKSERVIQLKEEEIVSFSVQKKDSQLIELTRENKIWKLQVPVVEDANQAEASSFLGDVLNEGRTARVMTGDSIDWSVYGLDSPEGSITVRSKDQATTVLVGKKNFKGEPYLRVEGINEVLTGNNMWAIKIEQPLKDFRNRRVFKSSISEIDELSLRNGALNIKLRKIDGQWSFDDVENRSLPVDPMRVQEVITQLQAVEGTDIVAEGEKFELFRKSLKLKKSQLGFQFKIESLSFYENQDGEKFIERLPEKKIYKVTDADFRKFKDYRHSSFRNKREFFNFSEGKVSEIHLSLNKTTESFIKEAGDQWVWKDPKVNFEFKIEKLKDMIKKLSSYEAFEFVDQKKTGIKNPITEIKMTLAEGAPPVEFKFFAEEVIAVGDEKFKVNKVISSLNPTPIYLKSEEVLSLGFNEIIIEKAKQ